jgi:hypothetical protein
MVRAGVNVALAAAADQIARAAVADPLPYVAGDAEQPVALRGKPPDRCRADEPVSACIVVRDMAW